MVEREPSISEEQLHAYVDGQIAGGECAAVEAWLASHPEDAARVAAWRAQAEAIRARYGSVINDPIPDRLTLKRIMGSQRSWSKVAAAAAVAAFVIGGAAGWMAHGVS